MDEMGDRLRQARVKAGFRSARSAALRFDWGPSTYAAHENGQNKFDDDLARRYARAFKVSAAWLLTGEGDLTPPRNLVPLDGYISAGGSIETGSEQREPGVEYEAELMLNVPEAAVAYQVVGLSMYPRYDPDMVLVCRGHTTDAKPYIGREVAVGTADGHRYLKILRETETPGLYDLESHNAPLMRNVELAWIAPIAAIIPADQWTRIERRTAAA